MDKVLKHDSFMCNTQSSEPFRLDRKRSIAKLSVQQHCFSRII